jgi:Polyketide cyclase / dehydrase and lipid transport
LILTSQSRGLKVRRRHLLSTSLFFSGFAISNVAHAAIAALPLLKVQRSISIAAPANRIWQIIGNFGDCNWMPYVTSTHAENGNSMGSIRYRKGENRGQNITATERLIRYSDKNRTYTYELISLTGNTEEVPFTSYSSTLAVREINDGSSVVVWCGSFRRVDGSPTPQAGRDDQAARDAVSDIYDRGLRHLKREAEHQ